MQSESGRVRNHEEQSSLQVKRVSKHNLVQDAPDAPKQKMELKVLSEPKVHKANAMQFDFQTECDLRYITCKPDFGTQQLQDGTRP